MGLLPYFQMVSSASKLVFKSPYGLRNQQARATRRRKSRTSEARTERKASEGRSKAQRPKRAMRMFIE